MTETACAHLHVHSEYSLLDGASRSTGLVERAASFGQPALGADRPRRDERRGRALPGASQGRGQADRRLRGLLRRRPSRRRGAGPRLERNHLTLLAPRDAGYRNLVQLSSAGFLEGLQRGKPTVDMAQIARYGEGVIALTGCLASRLCSRIADGRIDEGREHARPLIGALGADNVYFEVQKNGLGAAGPLQRGDRAARARVRPARSSAPATCTTCAARTTTTTPRCSACRPRARWPSRR